MIRVNDDLLWLFDQVAFEHGFKLPDRSQFVAVASYWHEPSGDADGTVTVTREGDLWIVQDTAHVIVEIAELRDAFVAAEAYVDQQQSAIAL